MYGKIVSSRGEIVLDDQTLEKEIELEHPVGKFSIIVRSDCEITFNDDPDFIYLPIEYTQPFEIDSFPIWKIKIRRAGYSAEMTDGKYQLEFKFSYYGIY